MDYLSPNRSVGERINAQPGIASGRNHLHGLKAKKAVHFIVLTCIIVVFHLDNIKAPSTRATETAEGLEVRVAALLLVS